MMIRIIKHLIDMGQCRVIKSAEHCTSEEEVLQLSQIRVNQLFESKKTAFITLISYEVNRTTSACTEHCLHNITLLVTIQPPLT